MHIVYIGFSCLCSMVTVQVGKTRFPLTLLDKPEVFRIKCYFMNPEKRMHINPCLFSRVK